MRCILLINVTAKVSFKGSKSLQIPQAPPPTFLFLLILQLSNNRQTLKPSPKPRSKLAPRTQTSNQPIRLSFLRTRDFVASSAAALVSEWAYRTIPFSKSTALFEKNDISFILLFSLRNFEERENRAVFRIPNGPIWQEK